MVGRGGFEPPKAMPTGLQPVPFGHSGTDPGKRPIPYRLWRLSRAKSLRLNSVASEASIWEETMPTFDISSELDLQEVRNAVDQAAREIANRFDFKGTESSVELTDAGIEMTSSTQDRIVALRQVVEEKMVRRSVSLKGLDFGEIADAAGGRVRQSATLAAGISSDKAKVINKHIKGLSLKGVSSSTQGNEIRVQGKKRDQLQDVIGSLRDADFGIPLQFGNFRD